jgi:hypothetical protein
MSEKILPPDEIARLAALYARATGLSLRQVGRLALGDPGIFVRLAAGRGCHVDTARRASRWLRRACAERGLSIDPDEEG